ncbi:transmembrane protein 164-like [Ptychodera flava]|uniref:transmembrane protein 164-like n=1 Tax=Ptychodera flava TaxID=63121 RepID=UPI00396AA143
MSSYNWQNMFDWAYGGVDPKFVGNGGPECANFMGLYQRAIETVVFTTFALLEVYYSWGRLKIPDVPRTEPSDRLGKRILLVVLCLTFGVEIGFKFATRTVIYLLNPCHLLTAIQIYLLAAPPSKAVLVIFRLHLSMLSGALLAIIFPVVNTRLLPFETEVYWLQHILIYIIIPPYLMKCGGVYTPEPLSDFWWVCWNLGVLFSYHFVPLHALAVVLQVNLNNMLCPAPSDPFYGRWYRVAAFTHQHAMVPLHHKLYTVIVRMFIPAPRLEEEKLCDKKG